MDKNIRFNIEKMIENYECKQCNKIINYLEFHNPKVYNQTCEECIKKLTHKEKQSLRVSENDKNKL